MHQIEVVKPTVKTTLNLNFTLITVGRFLGIGAFYIEGSAILVVNHDGSSASFEEQFNEQLKYLKLYVGLKNDLTQRQKRKLAFVSLAIARQIDEVVN